MLPILAAIDAAPSAVPLKTTYKGQVKKVWRFQNFT